MPLNPNGPNQISPAVLEAAFYQTFPMSAARANALSPSYGAEYQARLDAVDRLGSEEAAGRLIRFGATLVDAALGHVEIANIAHVVSKSSEQAEKDAWKDGSGGKLFDKKQFLQTIPAGLFLGKTTEVDKQTRVYGRVGVVDSKVASGREKELVPTILKGPMKKGDRDTTITGSSVKGSRVEGSSVTDSTLDKVEAWDGSIITGSDLTKTWVQDGKVIDSEGSSNYATVTGIHNNEVIGYVGRTPTFKSK